MPSRYDNITITAERSKDGWIIDRPVITRSGIFVYKADSLTSIRGMPITDGHRGILNTNSNLDGIVVGSVMGPGVKQDSDVVADIVIHNVNKIGKKRELSLGYECRIDAVPGEWNGQKYDQVQRD